MPKGIYQRTPEIIEKIIKNLTNHFKKGHKKTGGRQKGIPCSEETKRKISVSLKGKYRRYGKDNPMYGKIPWNKGIPRTVEEKIKMSKSLKGISAKDKNFFWTGGDSNKTKHKYIHKPEHPFCSEHGKIAEHRLVMEKHLGRYLTKKEVVHHINNIRNDNRIENLILFSDKASHSKHHVSLIKNKKFK